MLLSATAAAQAINNRGDIVKVKLANDLNALLQASPSFPNLEVTLYVKTGAIFEPDSMDGLANLVENILAAKIAACLRNNHAGGMLQNVSFIPSSENERAVFKLIGSPANLDACLALLRDSVLSAGISEAEMRSSLSSILQQIEDEKHDNRKVLESRIMKLLYVQDHEKLEVLGNEETLKGLKLKDLLDFYNKYYVTNNAILTVTGNFSAAAASQQIQNLFAPLIKGEFDPESIFKIHPIRPIAYAAQIVQEDTNSAPEFSICWQYPGTGAGRDASYPAFLLNTMLNDRNNFIRVKLNKLGCRKFTVQYDPGIFSAVLRVTFEPPRNNFFSSYNFVTRELTRLDETLFNREMVNAGKLEFKGEYAALKKSKDFVSWIAKTWSYNDESYFEELGDSVNAVTMNGLHNFIVEYMNQRPPIMALRISRADREGLQTDSAFAEVDRSVEKYELKYKQNITDVEGGENMIMLRNLLQWLKINDDVTVQVNGYSDEHEYNRVTDDTITRFIDSIPTFFKMSTDRSKKKGLRPEMMRAMKVIKYLYDHGIVQERLSGTAMMFKSANKQEETDNMKCTFTLNKYHNSPSLYEYHYGKKKEGQ